MDGLTDVSPDALDVRSYRLAGGAVAERFAEGHETEFPKILALYDEVHSWITTAVAPRSGRRGRSGPTRTETPNPCG